jgi:hypothetical protein
VPPGVPRLIAAGRQGDELIAHVDERHPSTAAAEAEVEDRPVELEGLVDVVDLERDVVHPDEARTRHLPDRSRCGRAI